MMPLPGSTPCAPRWAGSIWGRRRSLPVPGLFGPLLWICVVPAASGGGVPLRRLATSCEASLPPSVAAQACPVLAGYLQADSSGQIWPHYDRLVEFTGDAGFAGSTDAFVIDRVKTCNARLSGDTVVVSVLFRELGRVNIEQEEGRWIFVSGPRWRLLDYQLVHQSGAWRILLDPLPTYHIGRSAAVRVAPPRDLLSLRSYLARAARTASRLPEPSCP